MENIDFRKYFKIHELACKHVINRYTEKQCWSFFDPRLLKVLIFIRLRLGKSIIINHGTATQRGLRCNLCQLVKDKTNKNTVYMSSHNRGTALDFHIPGLTAHEVRLWLEKIKLELPYPIRVESDVTWVHIDVDNMTEQKIQYFKG